jgi:hypothetical protein
VAYHYDGSHHLMGTEEAFGGHTHSFDATHSLTGTMAGPQFNALQADLTSAFRRLC